MSLSMFLEMEQGAALDDIRVILQALDVKFEEDSAVLSGYFGRSNCHFVFKYESQHVNVAAEGAKVQWSVGLRGAFHYRADNLHTSWIDIVGFLRSYSGAHPFRFILSFHYETIYAKGGGGKLEFVGPLTDQGELVG